MKSMKCSHAAKPGSQISRLQRLRHRSPELRVLVDGSHPVGVRGGVVVAPSLAVTLDEGPTAEVLQAGTGRSQRLPGSVGASISMLMEK